ncbi:23S rRNA pseudouridine(955/2504/2580) synthase RluC [Aliiglaciecola sp. CAU 1673]|uniref:23S rRNA pseudouridine(955/2504/2580) synthase RluC n=1 Tax=Aliiglaciecola sp. CAU 1673 TaxID=3032595 RepID=UPI0023DC0DF4|nr:23S rRNA pseudouridine(955/2504/2580) synthase RluC [Aliiglaciecola sp. CAU 1673]MDF2177648.1 23S rRNA pseudouridine(955/2504/2580) synthase RluC [Aliiglaciecola sp. CAU 1673]
MTETNPTKVQLVQVDPELEGQRIDNFLRTFLKGVPKSLIYRVLRKGEVRVNKKRVKPDYKLQAHDEVRIPPVKVAEPQELPSVKLNKVANLEQYILFEDDQLIAINKPSGMAVHGGSGLSFGVIEALRALRPEQKFLELVHRLDRDTSGCLLVAKRRSALKSLHEQLREKQVDKRYHALVSGHWPASRNKVKAALRKNILKSGERMVSVAEDGKESETRYRVLQSFEQATLVEAFPVTGRTHQIRVHCQYAGHCIGGDDKYNDEVFNLAMQEKGLHRLFLHAYSLSFMHPKTGERQTLIAPLDPQLSQVLKNLSHA